MAWDRAAVGRTLARVAVGALLCGPALAETAPSEGIFYREAQNNGLLYVFAQPSLFWRWEQGNQTEAEGFRRSLYGPLGETVIFDSPEAIALFDIKHGRQRPVPEVAARTGDDGLAIKVGATLFADMTYTAAPAAVDATGSRYHSSAFGVGRAYVNVTGRLARRVTFRVTPDVRANTNDPSSDRALSGSNVFRLKFGLLQVDLDGPLTKGSWVRLGLQPTPFIELSEGAYRYRFQGLTFTEREGYLSSADYGIAGRLPFPDDRGDLQFGVYNGETFGRFEVNDQKSFQARLGVRPFGTVPQLKGLRLVAFANLDRYEKRAVRNRYLGAAYFEHSRFRGGFEYLRALDRNPAGDGRRVSASGFSIWATPLTRYGLEGLVRYDSLQPDRAFDGRKTRLVGGVAYWFPASKGVQLALMADAETVRYGRDLAPGLLRPTERRFSIHSLTSF